MITPVCSVSDLGIYDDSDVWMRFHVTTTATSCPSVLRPIHSIWSVTRPVAYTAIIRRLIGVDTVGLRQRNSCWSAASATPHRLKFVMMNAVARLVSLSGSTIMSLRFCAIFTGCVHRREPSTVWRCLRSVVNMESLHRTCHRSSSMRLTLYPDDTCGRQQRHWSCLGRNRWPWVSSSSHTHVE